MAQPVYLELQLDGNDIEGESTVDSMDRRNKIECLSFHYGLVQPITESTGARDGSRQHMQVTIQKRLDNSSPLLLKALVEAQSVDEATFRFYRPDQRGAEEHFYTVSLRRGFISSAIQESKAEILGVDGLPMLEEVKFVFNEITWTYESNGATARDTWAGRR